MERISQPVLAGILTALVGFTSSSAVVLTGLRAVGATPSEAASGLLAVCATQGLGILWLVRRHRIPLTLAWSTPGAALLASTGAIRGGWPAAIGAFLIVGGLILVTGLWPRLGSLITAIPTPIAQAMLAGVVLELCLDPVRGFAADLVAFKADAAGEGFDEPRNRRQRGRLARAVRPEQSNDFTCGDGHIQIADDGDAVVAGRQSRHGKHRPGGRGHRRSALSGFRQLLRHGHRGSRGKPQ